MSLWIEISGPFNWLPKVAAEEGFTGFSWGWLRVGHIPMGLNEFMREALRYSEIPNQESCPCGVGVEPCPGLDGKPLCAR